MIRRLAEFLTICGFFMGWWYAPGGFPKGLFLGLGIMAVPFALLLEIHFKRIHQPRPKDWREATRQRLHEIWQDDLRERMKLSREMAKRSIAMREEKGASEN
jgi:hypothetical protein